MAENIQKYTFAVDRETLKHIRNHLEGKKEEGVHGSYFTREAFRNGAEIIRYAKKQIEGKYEGKVLVLEANIPKGVAYDNLVKISDLPKGAKVTKEPRGKYGYECNVVERGEGVEMRQTKKMMIIAGPLKDQPGKYGLYTVHPGEKAPPFPMAREQLEKAGFKGAELDRAVEDNKGYKKFWDGHAFIRDK